MDTELRGITDLFTESAAIGLADEFRAIFVGEKRGRNRERRGDARLAAGVRVRVAQ